MSATVTFQAVFENGHLKPVDAQLDLRENESVWVMLFRDPDSMLVATRWDDPLLAEMRKRLRDLPSLDWDRTVSEERDRG